MLCVLATSLRDNSSECHMNLRPVYYLRVSIALCGLMVGTHLDDNRRAIGESTKTIPYYHTQQDGHAQDQELVLICRSIEKSSRDHAPILHCGEGKYVQSRMNQGHLGIS